MLDFILKFDLWLFHLINTGMANSLFDSLMPFITEARHWFLLYLFGAFLLVRMGKRGVFILFLLIITAVLSDQINSHILKDYFGRIRPCHTLEDIRLLVNCGAGKSFPSSHAANSFAAITVLIRFFRPYKWLFITIAVLIAFSRVYVGVHYPLDVIAGAAAGIVIGYAVLLAAKPFEKRMQ